MPQSEPQWLRETIDGELAGLFSDDREDIANTVSRLLERLPFDPELENELIDTLQSALELNNDDTDGSIWITLLLGEAAVTRAIPTFVDTLRRDDSEELQIAAGIAVLKCGTPGIEHLIESIDDEDPSPAFLRTSFQILAHVGYLRDEDLRQRVMDYLTAKIESEVVTADSLPLVEGIATAAGWLGHILLRPQLETMLTQFGGTNAALGDAIGMLDENDEGVAVIGELLPGEEEYHWAFTYSGETFRADSGSDTPEIVASIEGSENVALEDDTDDGEEDPLADQTDGYIRGLGAERIETDEDS